MLLKAAIVCKSLVDGAVLAQIDGALLNSRGPMVRQRASLHPAVCRVYENCN
ncbi:hypothetical protein PC116_g30098 [Phytophthora cactorum]|uniref:Uncharacterized protein n=1 Tax=Phytophthora cactorum TaxID=29920 RepID=A0A8T1EMI0_9STRA|nr:hypothetical protein PC111_g24283 [Phytophthora cactorum]KAG2787259.1 hypothetical protein PC112_g24543 [Phytophthora cactorum]KAG2876909.1 hypothetical protein PC117_g27170 [Phytophthora cactorum]KAG2956015.1 hypothetical protein PC118_g24664 [Phytophthora cactorum]KAG2967395.1 hypothetical protein PC120_g26961 [Phytophthora cactorum]